MMAADVILRIGPIDDGPVSESVYLLMNASGAVLAETRANGDVEGVGALLAGPIGPPGCEPSLSGAANALGLQIMEPSREQNDTRADVAMALAGADLPPTQPPARRISFLQGLGAMLGSPSRNRLADGQTALISVSGTFENEQYDVGISLAYAEETPDTTLFVAFTDFPAAQTDAAPATLELTIGLEKGAPFLVNALRSAYDLEVVPHLRERGRPLKGSTLSRIGPAMGAALYALADLYPDEGRRTVLYQEDNTPMQLRVSAGFGLANVDEIY